MVYKANINCQPTDALSQRNSGGTDDYDIDDDILIKAVLTRAKSWQDKHVHTTPDRALSEMTQRKLPKDDKFFIAMSTDAYCDKIKSIEETLGSSFSFNKNRRLFIIATIIGAVQKGLPKILRSTILHLAFHSTISGYPEKLRMYDMLQRNYFGQHVIGCVQ